MGWTMLHSATQQGHLDILKYYIEERKVSHSLYVTNIRGTNIFHTAANSNRLEVLKYLVSKVQEKGDNVVEVLDRTDMHGLSCIGHAAWQNNMAIVEYLYDLNVSVIHVEEEKLNTRLNITLLHVLCAYGELDFVRKLVVKNKMDVNDGKDKSFTPLHVAAFTNNTELIKYLISVGANHIHCVNFDNILAQLKLLQNNTELMERTNYSSIIAKTVFFAEKIISNLPREINALLLQCAVSSEENTILSEITVMDDLTKSVNYGRIKSILKFPEVSNQLDALKRYFDKKKRQNAHLLPVTADFILSL
jgi:ankyrin repeat protein